MEENLGSTCERLNICRVFGQKRNNLLCQAVLAADVGKRSDHIALINDEEALCLNMKAEDRSILNEEFCVCPGEYRPDRGRHRTKLGSRSERRVAASLQ